MVVPTTLMGEVEVDQATVGVPPVYFFLEILFSNRDDEEVA